MSDTYHQFYKKENLVKAAGILDSQPAEDPKDTIPTWWFENHIDCENPIDYDNNYLMKAFHLFPLVARIFSGNSHDGRTPRVALV